MNLYTRVWRYGWLRIGVRPATAFVGWIWHRDINNTVRDLRSELAANDVEEPRPYRMVIDPPAPDGLHEYLRLKEPWNYPDGE